MRVCVCVCVNDCADLRAYACVFVAVSTWSLPVYVCVVHVCGCVHALCVCVCVCVFVCICVQLSE